MARSLRLKVIAEGVENQAQVWFLRSHGCDEGQEFLFSRPVSATDLSTGFTGLGDTRFRF